MGKRRAWTLTAAAAGLAAVVAWLEHSRIGTSQSADAGSTSAPGKPASAGAIEKLPARNGLYRAGRDPFAPLTVEAPRLAATAAAPQPVQPPPNPYRFAGTTVQDGAVKVFLAGGDRVYEAKPGEMLDDFWRIKSVQPDFVMLLHVPTNVEQRVERPN